MRFVVVWASVLSCVIVVNPAFAARAAVPDQVSAFCIEAESGIVLFEHNADQVRPPASMIKLLMMLLVAEGLESGAWTLDTPITATRHAQNMGGTQVYLRAGEVQPLRSLMLAVAVASANDAAMAVAEGLWGSEAEYLDAANARAQELDMSKSVFRSVHGLPPDRGGLPDETTARDMAALGRECVRHSQVLEWTSTKAFMFRATDSPIRSTNRLLQQMSECDGLKTGYIHAAGFCVTATALRGDIRVVTVVMGHDDNRRRFQLAQQLMEDGLSAVKRGPVLLRETAERREVRIENGKSETVPVEVAGDISIIARTQDWDRVQLVWDFPAQLVAPVRAGTEVGQVRAELDGAVLGVANLVLADTVEESTWIWKTEQLIRSFLGED